ncbi:hypothetical protein L6452_35706 [Arctium lappa]|uniref:Uncharacterized protein n=1 Tax=Arctium lappa TaxID=4217 RepID=A0ACB8Y7P8_ARCLA|nr:hypothetical protein L6452_35706 [Arctium lappa]
MVVGLWFGRGVEDEGSNLSGGVGGDGYGERGEEDCSPTIHIGYYGGCGGAMGTTALVVQKVVVVEATTSDDNSCGGGSKR